MGLCFEFVLKTIDNIDGFVIAEQHLHSNKAFSASPTTLPGAVGAQEAGRGDS